MTYPDKAGSSSRCVNTREYSNSTVVYTSSPKAATRQSPLRELQQVTILNFSPSTLYIYPTFLLFVCLNRTFYLYINCLILFPTFLLVSRDVFFFCKNGFIGWSLSRSDSLFRFKSLIHDRFDSLILYRSHYTVFAQHSSKFI